MNTKNTQHPKKNQRQQTQPDQGSKKRGQNPLMLRDRLGHHEQEHPETRLTR